MLLDVLSAETGISKERLLQYSDTASKRYYLFSIPKRNGHPRWIAHPARPLKSLQRWLNARLIKTWETHSAATAYKKGASIRANAHRHAATNYTLRVDFEDFFPSFKRDGIEVFLKLMNEDQKFVDQEDIIFISKILTRNGELTIGAPSSPFITNAMMFEFDRKLSDYCEKKNLVYTRYADDIFISSYEPFMLDDAYAFVKDSVEKFPFAKLRLNSKKTIFLSRKYRRQITGLIITPDHRISLGRKRKKEIKSLVHRFSLGQLPPDKLDYAQGLVSFASDADEAFFISLTKKYGESTLNRLKRFSVAPTK